MLGNFFFFMFFFYINYNYPCPSLRYDAPDLHPIVRDGLEGKEERKGKYKQRKITKEKQQNPHPQLSPWHGGLINKMSLTAFDQSQSIGSLGIIVSIYYMYLPQ